MCNKKETFWRENNLIASVLTITTTIISVTVFEHFCANTLWYCARSSQYVDEDMFLSYLTSTDRLREILSTLMTYTQKAWVWTSGHLPQAFEAARTDFKWRNDFETNWKVLSSSQIKFRVRLAIVWLKISVCIFTGRWFWWLLSWVPHL